MQASSIGVPELLVSASFLRVDIDQLVFNIFVDIDHLGVFTSAKSLRQVFVSTTLLL